MKYIIDYIFYNKNFNSLLVIFKKLSKIILSQKLKLKILTKKNRILFLFIK